ncbi:hemerythrin domain-containing protein [Ideonella alba]|uniref:Hemerythrin domain-containing protein n=1 Tax=Ideonella alba TaxID=2824118 RepID=A0A940Y534_9BURK|nr:hemerythrin domain-containing protein [Ideonella alba]MBQ0929947.1 hemerythrin domain-containing protein [Ideonella alba]
MASLHWSPEIALDHPEMDQTHLEFVDLLAAAEDALARSPAEGLAAYRQLVEHTVGHFGQEDRWMAASGFAPENCHSYQHAQVLELMQEVTRLAQDEQDFGPLTRVLPELAKWFVQHAQSMDAALASHLQQVGFEPATGLMARPPVAEEAQTGCGGSSCSTTPAEQPAAA